jgi:HEAT repeat protein
MADYKDQLRKEIEDASNENEELIGIFLDESRPVKERLDAFEKAGTFNQEDHVKKALAIMRKASENDEIRAAALKGLVRELKRNEQLTDQVIAIIKDKSFADVLRIAALSVAQINTFSSLLLESKMPAYTDALRTIIDDENRALRETAIESLALKSDEYVQRRLIEGLNNPEKEIIRPEVAIQLLSYDLHADHFPILRRLAENPPNPRTKKEALRNLAADANSQDLLVRTLEDKNEDPETRHVCAVALQSLHAGSLDRIAKGLILDENEDEELKTALLNTLIHTEDQSSLNNDTEFEKKLDVVEQHGKSRNLKKVYSQYKAERKGEYPQQK